MKSSQINKLIEKYGRETSVFVCMEELGELIQAISKCERSRLGDQCAENDIDHLCEEIADTLICIRKLKLLYKLDSNRIKAWQNKKEKRTVKRYKL